MISLTQASRWLVGWGHGRVLRLGQPRLALVGFALMGVGSSAIFPLAMSAAAQAADPAGGGQRGGAGADLLHRPFAGAAPAAAALTGAPGGPDALQGGVSCRPLCTDRDYAQMRPYRWRGGSNGAAYDGKVIR